MTFIEINRVSVCYIEAVILFFGSYNIPWITEMGLLRNKRWTSRILIVGGSTAKRVVVVCLTV